MSEDKEAFLSAKQASEFLKTSEKTLRKWVNNGNLQAYRTPGNRLLFKVEDLLNFARKAVVVPGIQNFNIKETDHEK